jgi:hypothetical protein
MKIFLTTTLLLLNLNLLANECDQYKVTKEDLLNPMKIEQIPEAILAHYQQSEFRPIDTIGDFSLFRKAASTPKKIYWTLTNNLKKRNQFAEKISKGKNCAEELFEITYNDNPNSSNTINRKVREKDLQQILESDLSEDKKVAIVAKLQSFNIYLEGHSNPIKTNQFVDMIQMIIAKGYEKGINPSFGQPHDWSDEFKNSNLAKKSIMASFSKVLLALSRGETSQYLLSGHEIELEEWILEKEIESLYPHDLLEKSYELSKGDMYLTILTIENVLNKYWRANNRATLPITIRLKPIINSFGSNGDVFGAWYHLFGMMLYGYVEGSVSGKTVGTIETLGSHILSKFEDEKQEDFVNSKGGVIGGRIAHLIKSKNQIKIEIDENKLNPEYYLNLNENFIERLKKQK